MYNYNFKDLLKPEEVLIYLRKSRADDPTLSVEEVLSKHEERLDEWVEKNLSAPIPIENRFKEIVSGGDSVADRPEFQKVLKLIESPNIKAVLVVETSRLGRPDTEEIGKISKMFRYTNTMVITLSRAYDLSDKGDRDMFENELKMGQYYLEYSKIILKNGIDWSVKSGNYICSKPLYGYDKITITIDKKKCPTLAINEEQANIVRMVFNWFVNENIGTQVIANRLNDMGVKPPMIELWRADTIRRMLKNKHYIGMVKRNERKSSVVVDNGEFRKTRLKNTGDDYILCKGKHEPIISEELFYAAQAKLGRTHKTCDNKELRNPLASILYCECGRAMSYRQSTRGEGKPGKPPRLVCNGQHICQNGSCSPDEILEFVVDLLKQKISEYTEEVTSETTEIATFNEKQIKILEKKLADIDMKELALWEAQLDPETKIPPQILKGLTDKLSKERTDTEDALSKARELAVIPIDNETKRVTLQNALDALLDDEISVAEKNKFLKACFSRIIYSRGAAVKAKGKGGGKGWIYAPMELDVQMLF